MLIHLFVVDVLRDLLRNLKKISKGLGFQNWVFQQNSQNSENEPTIFLLYFSECSFTARFQINRDLVRYSAVFEVFKELNS